MNRTVSAELRKRPRQLRSAETVDRILDAAARIFDERGYRATTTNHVAAQAGVSIGSLYQYFPNKDALLVALAERHVAEAAERFGGRLAQMREEPPALVDAVRSLIELSVELNDSSRLHSVLFSDCPRTPALRERLDGFTEFVVSEVAWHLDRAGVDGEDPQRWARLVVAAVDAAVHEVVLAIPPGPGRRAAGGDHVDHGLAGRDRPPSTIPR
jgi:AcrR family transcriptional regulator